MSIKSIQVKSSDLFFDLGYWRAENDLIYIDNDLCKYVGETKEGCHIIQTDEFGYRYYIKTDKVMSVTYDDNWIGYFVEDTEGYVHLIRRMIKVTVAIKELIMGYK